MLLEYIFIPPIMFDGSDCDGMKAFNHLLHMLSPETRDTVLSRLREYVHPLSPHLHKDSLYSNIHPCE
eukprot:gnl/Chilomastix_caulleri/5257.p2 GENE.gnl/Chilomastix_caulleri/5257~~gnl/Chilomastix_caulleri/5257.p2  ORF type:complete len:68 (-),score=13.26 gnl/Chilomastix_caulleri/5257:25-228(-)